MHTLLSLKPNAGMFSVCSAYCVLLGPTGLLPGQKIIVSYFKATHAGSLGSDSLTRGFLGTSDSAPCPSHFKVCHPHPGGQKQSKAGQGICLHAFVHCSFMLLF